MQLLLQTEIKLGRWRNLVHAWRWLMDGLDAVVPPGPFDRWRRPAYRLIEITASGERRERIVERNLFDCARVADGAKNAEAIDGSLPIYIALDSNSYFETRLSLPREASAEDTISLRLEELSPIHPADAVFTIGRTRRHQHSRTSIAVAMASKKHLEEIRAQFSDKTYVAVGAAPDQHGELAFVFPARDGKATSIWRRDFWRSRWMRVMAIFAATAMLLAAGQLYMNKRTAALDDHEARLLQDLRRLRPVSKFTRTLMEEGIDPIQEQSLQMTLAPLNTFVRTISEETVLTRVSITSSEMHIEGFAPAGGGDTKGLGWERRFPDDRPGYERFRSSMPLEAMQ